MLLMPGIAMAWIHSQPGFLCSSFGQLARLFAFDPPRTRSQALATGPAVCVASYRILPIPCGFAVPVFLWQARISSNAGKIANRVSSSYLTSNHSASNRTATTGTIVRTQLGCITSRFLRPTVHRMPPARVNLVPRIVTADRWLRRCLSVLALSRSAFLPNPCCNLQFSQSKSPERHSARSPIDDRTRSEVWTTQRSDQPSSTTTRQRPRR